MNALIRNLTLSDFEQIRDAMVQSYLGIGGQFWRKPRIEKLIQLFPEGQFCVELDGKVVACALSIIISADRFTGQQTYEEVTGSFSFDTHDPNGDVLYGLDVFVHPSFRGLGLGRRLYDARKACCTQRNLRSIRAGGRIPNYHKVSNKLTPDQYVEQVQQNKCYDPTLSFQLANNFQVKQIMKNYLKVDIESGDYATFLEWNNVCFKPDWQKDAAIRLKAHDLVHVFRLCYPK